MFKWMQWVGKYGWLGLSCFIIPPTLRLLAEGIVCLHTYITVPKILLDFGLSISLKEIFLSMCLGVGFFFLALRSTEESDELIKKSNNTLKDAKKLIEESNAILRKRESLFSKEKAFQAKNIYEERLNKYFTHKGNSEYLVPLFFQKKYKCSSNALIGPSYSKIFLEIGSDNSVIKINGLYEPAPLTYYRVKVEFNESLNEEDGIYYMSFHVKINLDELNDIEPYECTCYISKTLGHLESKVMEIQIPDFVQDYPSLIYQLSNLRKHPHYYADEKLNVIKRETTNA